LHPGAQVPFQLASVSDDRGEPWPALVVEEHAIALAALASLYPLHGHALRGAGSMLAVLESWDTTFPALEAMHASLLRDRAAQTQAARALVPLSKLQIHAPIQAPRQIFCSGANYRKHVIDLIIDQDSPENAGMDREQRRAYATQLMDRRAASGKPFVFNKCVSTITGPFDAIVLPREAQQPDWELELGVLIGRPTRRVPRSEALSYVAGYVIVNDITERTLVFRPDIPQMGMDWLSSKNSPTFLPMGPYLTPAAFVKDPQDLRITLRLNGEIKQDESTADMIIDVARIIEFISATVQLRPGDLICSGSPSGNGTHYNRFLRHGDVVEGSISGLGMQRNVCRAESD
jgi:2-keto-4-pentenoate hydratase/2-oxohepta-3-ene-1,7-dioic acid hydratase in catechol pathway